MGNVMKSERLVSAMISSVYRFFGIHKADNI